MPGGCVEVDLCEPANFAPPTEGSEVHPRGEAEGGVSTRSRVSAPAKIQVYATARSPVRANAVSSLTDRPWMPSLAMVRPRRQ